jgi:hypothetical protein
MKRIAGVMAFLLLCAAYTPAIGEERGDWTERLSFKGDLRLRYEGIDEQGEEGRERGRYRARLGVSADVLDNVKVVMQLASGADNPVSRNVTFDGGFDVDDIGFDLAYVEWTANDRLTIFGGKMKNPLFRAGGIPLLWDSDLNPEGLALAYRHGAFFGTLANFAVEERSSSSDSLLTAVQAGGDFTLGDNARLKAGAGYFGYSNTIGNEPFWDGLPHGNSVDIDGNYLYEYKVTEAFAQLDTKLGSLPLTVAAQWARNGEVDEEDTAWAIGARIGAAGAPGSWDAGWAYMNVEADALVSTFNDSDFAGGQTDGSGHILQVRYALSESITLAGTFFRNEIDRFAGNEHDYNRYQLDVQFSFR